MAKIIDLVTNAGQVDVTRGIVEEALNAVPEMQFFDADTIAGTVVNTLARTSLPDVAFRNIGDAVSSSRSQYELRPAILKMLSGRAEVSDAEILANGLMGREDQLVHESVAVLVAAFKRLAKQIWCGDDAKGFTSALQLVDASMVTRAGDGAADANTSVWFVGNGAKTKCGILFSNNSGILSDADLEFRHGDIAIKDGDGKVVGVEPGWIGDLTSYAGFHVANKNSLARLCNVTAATGLNDDMLTDCIEAYGQANNGAKPDGIFMSFAARKMLRKSRNLSLSKVGGGKLSAYAPIPTDIDGIPIFATDCILDTEAVVAAPSAE